MPDLPPFPFQHTQEVIFRDVDMLGHVNHAQYFTYFEAARMKFLMNFFTNDQQPWPVILVRASCDYKAPAFLGDLLTIHVGVSRWGNTSFTITYRCDRTDTTLATAETTLVMYDYATEKPFPIPKAFRERIETFQSGWQLPVTG